MVDHIHHLSPRTPNHPLEQAYNENDLFHVKPITLRSSMKSLKFRLYDEENHRLVGFGYVKEARQLARSRGLRPYSLQHEGTPLMFRTRQQSLTDHRISRISNLICVIRVIREQSRLLCDRCQEQGWPLPDRRHG